MSSRHVDTVVTPGRVEIIIEHNQFDSFSRSVGPRASRALRAMPVDQLLAIGNWQPGTPFTREQWIFDTHVGDGLSRTIVPFSFPQKPPVPMPVLM